MGVSHATACVTLHYSARSDVEVSLGVRAQRAQTARSTDGSGRMLGGSFALSPPRLSSPLSVTGATCSHPKVGSGEATGEGGPVSKAVGAKPESFHWKRGCGSRSRHCGSQRRAQINQWPIGFFFFLSAAHSSCPNWDRISSSHPRNRSSIAPLLHLGSLAFSRRRQRLSEAHSTRERVGVGASSP